MSDYQPNMKHKPRWSVRVNKQRRQRGWWFVFETPPYANGRGPYISVGLWVIAIYRGY